MFHAQPAGRCGGARGVIDMQYGRTYVQYSAPNAGSRRTGSVHGLRRGSRANGGFCPPCRRPSPKSSASTGSLTSTPLWSSTSTPLTSPSARMMAARSRRAWASARSRSTNSFFESLGSIPSRYRFPTSYTGHWSATTFDGSGWPIVAIKDLSWDKFLRYLSTPASSRPIWQWSVNPAKWDGSRRGQDLINPAAAEYEQTSYDNFQAMISENRQDRPGRRHEVIPLERRAASRYLDGAYDSAWTRMKEDRSEHYDALRKSLLRPLTAPGGGLVGRAPPGIFAKREPPMLCVSMRG